MNAAGGRLHGRMKINRLEVSAFLNTVSIRPSTSNFFSTNSTKRNNRRGTSSILSTPPVSRCRMQIDSNDDSQVVDPEGSSETNSVDQPGTGELKSENGPGYEESFAANFHILLPLLTKLEEDDREESGEEDLHNFVDMLSDRLLSTHRMSPQLRNLRPFAKRSDAERICADCGGAGERKCPYCDGEGFIEMDLKNFDPNFEGWVLAPPKRAVGNYFHCPLCGGRCIVRCETCAGSGTEGGMDRALEGRPSGGIDNLPKYAAGDDAAVVPAIKPFIMEEFLEEHKDRIEHTDDGLIILRAPKRRRRKSAKNTEDKVETAGSTDVRPPRRRRGRPRKHPVKESPQIEEKGEKMKRSPGRVSKQTTRPLSRTDFLHITDFKVGQQLSLGELDIKNEEEDDASKATEIGNET